MEILKRYRTAILIAGVAVLVLGFLAFRPDKLFVDDAVDESLEDAFAVVTEAPQEQLPSSTTTTTATPESGASATTVPTTTAAPIETPAPGPRAVTTGAWYGIDHGASGSATIYEQDGRFVLRFEDDTDIQNGPDLWVWVLPSADYEGGDPEEFIDLGKIKGNVGGQNYELPAEFDPAVHRSVLIWCLRFGVPFAAVPLA